MRCLKELHEDLFRQYSAHPFSKQLAEISEAPGACPAILEQDLSDDELSVQLADSLAARALSVLKDRETYRASTLQTNISPICTATWQEFQSETVRFTQKTKFERVGTVHAHLEPILSRTIARANNKKPIATSEKIISLLEPQTDVTIANENNSDAESFIRLADQHSALFDKVPSQNTSYSGLRLVHAHQTGPSKGGQHDIARKELNGQLQTTQETRLPGLIGKLRLRSK